MGGCKYRSADEFEVMRCFPDRCPLGTLAEVELAQEGIKEAACFGAEAASRV